MWFIYTMEYSSAIKKETMSFIGKWMEFVITILNVISQAEEDKYYIFSLMCRL
jgi:hypothetical protein